MFKHVDVYVCITEWNPETEALLAKRIIDLFGWDGGYEHLTDDISCLMPLGENKGEILNSFKFRQSVARPNFIDMQLAQDGTVLFRDVFPQ